tara:strand:- start:107 stop:439 length:333 start_codon:yes stop_codon:yes gene_type:complete
LKNNLPKYSLYSKGNFQKKDQIKGPKCGQSGTGNEDKCSIGLLLKKFTTLRYQNVFVSQSKVNSYAIFIDKIIVKIQNIIKGKFKLFLISFRLITIKINEKIKIEKNKYL